MIIRISQDANGVWRYHDRKQAEFATLLLIHTGWEIAEFDSWLSNDANWADDAASRQELMQRRHRLMLMSKSVDKAFKSESESLYLYAQAIQLYMSARILSAKADAFSQHQAAKRKGKTSLTLTQQKRVASQYDTLVRSGEKYGAIKALARQFEVSESTIKNIIKSVKVKKNSAISGVHT